MTRAFAAVGVTRRSPRFCSSSWRVTRHAALYRVHLLLNPSLEQRFSTRLRTRLYAAIVAARWSLLVRRRASDLVHAVTAHVDRSSTAAYQLLTLLTGLAVTAVYVLLALRLSFTVTVLVVMAGALMLWTFRGRTTALSQLGRRYAMPTAAVCHDERVDCRLKVAKSLAAEPRDVAIFTGLAEPVRPPIWACCDRLRKARCGSISRAHSSISALLYIAVSSVALSHELLLLIFVFARLMPRAMALQESAQPSWRDCPRLPS